MTTTHLTTRIPLAGPWVTDREVAYVADAAANAWYDNAYTFNERFERAFADYLGVRFAVSLPHCTAAIHLALAALGVGEGDEVIVPDVTWIASAAPIQYVGATPVFADIDRASWCLSAESFERNITPRTKAVIVVDLYGNMPDCDAIRAIARQHDIAVIEDAAEAIGSQYHGRMAGSLGDVGVFSFHGSKTLTTGEGGMLVTDDEALHQRVLFLRDHGRDPGDRHFFNREVAFKYRMSSLQAAFGLAQIERIDELVTRKRDIFARYDQLIGADPRIELNPQLRGTVNSYWMTTAVIDGVDKHELMAKLEARGIDSRPFFHPLTSIPAYADYREAGRANVHAYAIAPHGINLPSAMNLTRDQIKTVCDVLREVLDA
jgi:perosamine synthetase